MPPSPQSLLGQLLAAPMRPGRLVWIGLRPARDAAIITPQSATLIAGRGISGDRYQTSRDGARQVTIMSLEGLRAIASYLAREQVAPDLLRRNLVTEGINLTALKGRRFHIGTALLKYSGECAPCSRMETNLGPGGYNAVSGNGGITARIIEGGEIRLDDQISRIDEAIEDA